VPAFDVAHDLIDQLDWHWNYHLRPRLDGLTDAEYFWEPVDGCWSIRLSGNRFVQEGKPMRVAERAPFTNTAVGSPAFRASTRQRSTPPAARPRARSRTHRSARWCCTSIAR